MNYKTNLCQCPKSAEQAAQSGANFFFWASEKHRFGKQICTNIELWDTVGDQLRQGICKIFKDCEGISKNNDMHPGTTYRLCSLAISTNGMF